MTRTACFGSVFAAAIALQTGVHAHDDVYMDAAITAPADGAWFDVGDEFEMEGWSLYDSVDVRIFNVDEEEWESMWQVEGRDEGYVNPYGNRAYSWSVPRIQISPPDNRAYHARGATRETGQRSNAIYYSVEGWGSTPELDHSYYMTVYVTCGQAGQGCCVDSDSPCDAGLLCSQNQCKPGRTGRRD